jgi:hypothetical protein
VTQAGALALISITLGDGYFLGSNAGNFKAGVGRGHWSESRPRAEEAVAKRAGVGFAGFDADAKYDITGRDLDPRRCVGGRNARNYVVRVGVLVWIATALCWRTLTVGIRFGITA